MTLRRDGSLILSETRGPATAIVCALRGQRGTCGVASLIEQQIDAKLTAVSQHL